MFNEPVTMANDAAAFAANDGGDDGDDVGQYRRHHH